MEYKTPHVLLRKTLAGFLAVCIMAALPGGSCYAALGSIIQAAPKTQASKPLLTAGYLHYLFYQGLSQTSYLAQSQERRNSLRWDFLEFTKKALKTFEVKGLSKHSYWKNKLLDQNLELTPLAVELAWTLENPNAALLEKPTIQSLDSLRVVFEKNPKILSQPESMRREIHFWFENNRQSRHPGENRGPGLDSGLRRNDDRDLSKNLPTKTQKNNTVPPKAGVKEKQLETRKFLADPKKSKEALAGEMELYRKAAELAALKTLKQPAKPANGKKGPPSLLADRMKALEESQKNLENQIKSYERRKANFEGLQEVYRLASQVSQTDEAMQNLIKSNTALVQTMLLKRGYHFLSIANRKLEELQKRLEEEKAVNAANQEQLVRDREWAAARLKKAEELLRRAQKGEFTDKVKVDIKKIQDAKGEADKIKRSIGDIKDLLRGGFGDLTKTFLDREAVLKEIRDWEDNLQTARENYQKAFFFIDPMRTIAHTEPDDMGDPHFKSAHLWAQQAVAEMNAAEAQLRQHSVDIHRTEDLFKELETNPDAFYIGVKGDPELQAKPEDARKLILRRQGQAVLVFAKNIIKFKVAESTLNGIHHAYLKDAAFNKNIGPEPYYESTAQTMREGKAKAQQLITFIVNELEFVRPRLVQEEVVTHDEITKLQDRVREQFRNNTPEGYAHRAYAIMLDAMKVMEDSVRFSREKYNFLSSGPTFFQIMESGLLEKQADMADRLLKMADELLDFLIQYHLPAEAGKTDMYDGFVTLYGDAYKTLYDAYQKFYDKEKSGMEDFDKTLQDLADPFKIDFKNVKEWLAKVNPKEDLAIRRMGRALAAAGDQHLERLRKKKFLIEAANDIEKQRTRMKAALSEIAARRETLKAAFENARLDDPAYAEAREMLLAGDLFYGQGDVSEKHKSPVLFGLKNMVNQTLSGFAANGGKRMSANEWINTLGLNNYEVIPLGSGPDAFYTVVKFSAGMPIKGPMASMFENAEGEALFKLGNIGRMGGGNLSVTFYDWKELGGAPLGARGIRGMWERDNKDEKFINTTVLDIHQNLQQGDIFRAMVFENMALMLLGDRLFISMTGFADLPIGEGRMDKGEDAAPYTYGGRTKAVFYLHEVASVNAEIMSLFAKDPYEFARQINTSIDPLAIKEENLTIQGAILKYLKRHAGIEIDLGKLIDKRQTLSMEFFLEDEKASEIARGDVSEEYIRDFKDKYSKTWKGARILKEIHFNAFGGRSTARLEGRAAWDQDGQMEPSAKLAFILPQGIVFEAQGARYQGRNTAKGAVSMRLPYGNEIYASYGNDRVGIIPRLTLGLKNSITLDELRRDARKTLEKTFHGGDTLSDFMELFDKKMPRGQQGQVLTLSAGMRRVFEQDPKLRRIIHAIGTSENSAVDLQWAFKAGMQINSGYMYGRGYQDAVTGEDQSAYGNPSTAGGKRGGIQVGGELFLGWTEPQKEAAVKEIAKMKSLLADLRASYEDSMKEFRLGAFRMVTAKLRLAQIDQMAAHKDVKENAALRARLEQERIQTRADVATAEVLLRHQMGLGIEDALPRELTEIPIDPANPAKTLETASKVLAENGDWKKLLRALAKADPKDGTSLDLGGKIVNAINIVKLLPLVDDLTISIGGNLPDTLGNSFFGAGAMMRLSLWDPEAKLHRRIKGLEAKSTNLETEEKILTRQYLKKTPARMDRWLLTEQKRMLEELVSGLSRDLNGNLGFSERLKKLEDMVKANTELSRVQLELLALPPPEPEQKKQAEAFTTLPEMAQKAVERGNLTKRLALQRQIAEKMEEAAKERFSLAMRIGARWNPVANVWYETATQTFFTGGKSLFMPTFDIKVKSRGLTRKEEEIAKSMKAALEADHSLQVLDIKRQMTEAYLRLLYLEEVKRELAEKMRQAKDQAEFTQFGVLILELRKTAGHECTRLLVLLGLDPDKYEIDLSSLKTRDARKESTASRAWIEKNLKDASKIKQRALESKIKMVQAMEGKILMMESAKNIRTEPIGYLMQAAGEILTSIFSEGGLDTASQAEFDSIHRYRQNLEMELRRFKDSSTLMSRRSEARLVQAAQKLEADKNAANQMEFELARAAHASEGWEAGPNGERPFLSLKDAGSRKRPPMMNWGARIYQTEEALPKPDKIGKKNVYYQNGPGKDVVFVEGFTQIFLKNPHRIKPGMFTRLEELDREKELRQDRLESDMKQARLSGLLWKYRYLTGELDKLPDTDPKRGLVQKKVQETKDQIKREHGLEPTQYPHELPHSPIPTENLKALANHALKFMVGEAPILGPLSVDLAQGRVYAQNVLENLRYQSMNPSLVLGYLRKGLVGGIFITSPVTGQVPGANVFQDIEALVSQNMDASLSAASLVREARERLATNAIRIPYLLDEIAQVNAFMAGLKEELAKDPKNVSLIERYHQAYEDSLEATARLHALYLQTETDLKLLGVRIPKGLGRSSRDPWTLNNRKAMLTTTALSNSEALKMGKDFNPALLTGWETLAQEDRQKRIDSWEKDLEYEISKLSTEDQKRVREIAEEIQKDGFNRFEASEAAGALSGLNEKGQSTYEIRQVISRGQMEDLRAKNRLHAFHPVTGRRLPLDTELFDGVNSRLLAAPVGFVGPVPETIEQASQAGFTEFLESSTESERRFEETRKKFSRRVEERKLDNEYHRAQESFVLSPSEGFLGMPGSQNAPKPIRLILEEEALEAARRGQLKLFRGTGSQELDSKVLSERQFWKQESMDIYLTGDYRFADAEGRRVWTLEEMLREGRLLVFIEEPLKGGWKRVSVELAFQAESSRPPVLMFGYFGNTPELLSGAETPEELKEFASELRAVTVSALGTQTLKKRAKQDLRRANQASMIYLKSAYGFRMKNGVLEAVYLTEKSFERARNKGKVSASDLFLSGDLTLHLDSEGNILKTQMRSLTGEVTERSLEALYDKAGPITRIWEGKMKGKVEMDREFRVKRIYSKRESEEKIGHLSMLYDDFKLYPIHKNRFPGFGRILAMINPTADTIVIDSTEKLAEMVGDSESDLTRVQIRPWILTLGLAFNITTGFMMSSWTLPLSATVGAANVSDRVAALTGEGAMDQELPPVLEQIWGVVNFLFFEKIIPQLQEKLYDPSGYPKLVAKDPPSFFDKLLYYATLTLAGRTKDRYVEVDPKTNKITRRVVTPGAVAFKRQIATLKQDYENAREQILASFKSGVTVRETKMIPGVFGDWKQTQVHTLSRGEAYDQVMENLKNLGVRFAPDGSFDLEIVPNGTRVSGSKIKGVKEAEEDLKTAEERQQYHKAQDGFLWGAGGIVRYRFKDGELEKREPLEGAGELEAWRKKLKGVMQNTPQVAYNPKLKMFMHPSGSWMYNADTAALVFFDEQGRMQEVLQAVFGSDTLRNRYRQEKLRHEFFTQYPELLSQGGIVRLDGDGNVLSYSLGRTALENYQKERGRPEGTLPPETILERPDGGRDMILLPLAQK